MSEFEIDMQHVKGKENRVADALSIKMHNIYELYVNQVECRFLDQIRKEAGKDPEYEFLWQQAQDSKEQGRLGDYEINQDGLLVFKERIVIPNRMELKTLILDEYHRSIYGGHPRYQKMLTTIRKD